MRRLTAWIGGAASGVVAYRFWRRHREAAPAGYPEPASEPDDRAEELRAKLAESREADTSAEPVAEEQRAEPEPEPEATAETAVEESPEQRRQRVYEEGRAALDEMKSE